MYAVVSLLDAHHYELMEDLWRELEAECGLAGVSLTPLPHFSWHIASEYDLKTLESTLETLSAASKPFTVRASGLGIFTGLSPVIFIPLIKNKNLSNFHRCIWERSNQTAVGASGHYSPEAWIPHITLAYGDVDANKLGCAMERLAFRPFQWEITVDHIALVYQISGQVGRLQRRFDFGSSVGDGCG